MDNSACTKLQFLMKIEVIIGGYIHTFEFVGSFTSPGQILLLVTPQVPVAPTSATGTYLPFRSSIQCPTKLQECCGSNALVGQNTFCETLSNYLNILLYTNLPSGEGKLHCTKAFK